MKLKDAAVKIERQWETALAMGSLKEQAEARDVVVARHRAERKAAEKARKAAAKEKNK